MNTPIGAKARLELENTRLQIELDATIANVVYLLRYIIDLQEEHGETIPFPELENRFTEHDWRAVL